MSHFDSIRQGNFGITFDNGVRVSVFFGAGSYSDNSNLDFGIRLKNSYEAGTIESKNTEVMVGGSDEVDGWMCKKWGGNPAGFLSAKEVLQIMNKAQRAAPPLQAEL